MKRTRKLLALLLSVVLIVGCLTGPASSVDVASTGALKDSRDMGTIRGASVYADDDVVTAIILMDGQSVAQGPKASSGETAGRIAQQHSSLRSSMKAAGVSYTMQFDYDTLLNGMAVSVTVGDLKKIAALNGVESVHIANTYDPPEVIQMETSNDMTGATFMHDSNYIGSGQVIAVLDTGITPQHEAFQAYDGMLQSAAITADGANAAITDLGYGTYLSQKVPFSYDYADLDGDANDDKSGHGTHVSGIAAGYAQTPDGAATFIGTAPDAQILAMKIFTSGAESTTNSAIYFKALEDAYNMGADVVNMSIGAQNGFSYDPELEDEVFGNIYQTLVDNGVAVVVAAGNEGSQADYASNWAGAGYVTSDYTEYGVVGSPATYGENFAVASAENAAYRMDVISAQGRDIGYNDSASPMFHDAFAGKENVEYVVVPGFGEPSDFEGLDVSGRVALISRGSITFQEKVLNAAAAGAIGAIIYNNQAGVISMAIDDYPIPAVSILKDDGDFLISIAADGVGVMSFPEEKVLLQSDTAWEMSSFSSMGPTPDLILKPMISGIGGNVTSAANGTTSDYVLMSGTSMATPNVAGAMADVFQFMAEQYPDVAGKARVKMAEALMESTALLLADADGYIYSPRKQGAGLINLRALTQAQAYITEPVTSLGDSEDGQFQLSFTVQSLSDADVTYKLDFTGLLDYIVGADLDQDGQPEYYNSTSSDYLDIEDVTLDAPEAVTVPAGGAAKVDVGLSVNADMMEFMAELAPNGWFLDGFVTLEPEGTSCDGTDCPSSVFVDAPEPGHWAHDGIDYCVTNKLFQGVSPTKFDPEGTMTRGMMVTVLYRLDGEPETGAENPFTDVADGDWYKDGVLWASGTGVTDGTSATTFSPALDVTREQIATFLWRYAQYKEYDMGCFVDLDTFPDGSDVSDWARDAMSWAVGAGLIKGSRVGNADKLLPQDKATRAQVATILHRFAQAAGIAPDASSASALHATFTAFCGDWTKAPIMDAHDWRDIVDIVTWLNTTPADTEGNTYADYGYTYLDAADFQINTDLTMVYALNYERLAYYGQLYGGYAGDNLFAYAPYYDSHIAISPASGVDTIYAETMLLRNARHLIMVATNAETGEVYYVDDTEYLPKTYYDTEYGYWVPTGSFIYDGTDAEGNIVPSGTVVSIDFYGNLPYGEDALGAIISGDAGYGALRTQGSAFQLMHFDVTVDYDAPEITDVVYDAEARTLTVTASDNHFLAYMELDILDGEDLLPYDAMGISEPVRPDGPMQYVFEDVDPGSYVIFAADYAANETESDVIIAE